MVVLRTLGAPQRRLRGRRRPRRVRQADATPVPTARATLVRPSPFESVDEAARWLRGLGRDTAVRDSTVAADLRVLNSVMRAYRLASADPHAPTVSRRGALAVRVGYGPGEEVADGRFAEAFELPIEDAGLRRRGGDVPEQRMAAILGCRESPFVAEDLTLRARADLDAQRPREAALQCRIALESAVVEAGASGSGSADAGLEDRRGVIGQAANAALHGDPSPELQAAVEETLTQIEALLRRLRSRS